ncbi:MAG: hypothetical protein AB7F88_09120 [Pyrinomonadaceae bacterium]
MRVHGIEKTYAVGDIVTFSVPEIRTYGGAAGRSCGGELSSRRSNAKYLRKSIHEIATIIDAGGRLAHDWHYRLTN